MDEERIVSNLAVMGGRPCIRGTRVTVGTIVGLLSVGKSSVGKSVDEVLDLYPYVTRPDVLATLAYAAWRSEERELAIA